MNWNENIERKEKGRKRKEKSVGGKTVEVRDF